jgi:hypothetical protein
MKTTSEKSWRDEFRVHPAAEVFPMLEPDELSKLGQDIETNGLREPIVFFLSVQSGEELLDGRNRLEAMSMVGLSLSDFDRNQYVKVLSTIDPYCYVISKNLRRRHLSKAEQARLIVEVEKAREKNDLDHLAKMARWVPGERGSAKDPFKEKVVEQAKEQGISQRTAERAIAGERTGVDGILADLEKKKARRRHPASLANPKYPGAIPQEQLKPPDNNRRICSASCCNGKEIAGPPVTVHEAQALLDPEFEYGFFGQYHDALLKKLVAAYWDRVSNNTLRGGIVSGLAATVVRGVMR